VGQTLDVPLPDLADLPDPRPDFLVGMAAAMTDLRPPFKADRMGRQRPTVNGVLEEFWTAAS